MFEVGDLERVLESITSQKASLHLMADLDSRTDPYAILNHLPNGICIVRQDWTVELWNTTLQEWTGLGKTSIEGRPLRESFPHLTTSLYRSRLQPLFEGGPSVTFDPQTHPQFFPALLPGGQLRIQHTIAQSVRSLETDSWNIMFVVQDVSCLHGQVKKSEYFRAQALHEIEEHKKTETALRHSEERFELAVKGTNDGIWDWPDINEDQEWWSPQFYRFLGYEPNEIPASISNFKELLHPDDHEATFSAMEKHFKYQVPFGLEYRLRTKSGEYRWFYGTGYTVRDDAGVPIRMVGSIQDITEEKHTKASIEERIRLSEFEVNIDRKLSQTGDLQHMLQECAETFVEHLRAPVARIWLFNDKEQTLDLKASAGLYTHLDEGHGKIEVEKYKIEQIAAQQPHTTNNVLGDPLVTEQEWARQEGMVAFAEYPLLMENELIGVIALFARHQFSALTLQMLEQVAKSIALGIKRKRTEEKVRELSNFNASILASAGEGIYGLDLQGNTTFVNPEGARLLGYSPEELIDQPMHSLVHHSWPNGSSYPQKECPMYAAINDGTVHHIDNEVLWRKDGTNLPVEYTSTPMRNEEGDVIGAVVTFRDITERKAIECRIAAEHDIAKVLTETSSLDEAAILILQAICTSLNWQVGAFWKPHTMTPELYCVGIFETTPNTHPTFREETFKTTFIPGIGLPGRVWKDGKPAWIQDVTVDDNFPRAHFAKNEDLYTGLAFPIRIEGQIHGVMEFFCREPLDPNSDLLAMMENIGHHIGQFAERKEAELKVATSKQVLEQQNHELAIARDEALAAVKAKTEFLATMSHEIRTPLNGVIGMTGLLMDTPLTEEQQELANTVKHSGELLLDLINDILDFSKIEAGKLDLEMIDFDLRAAVEEVLELLAERASNKEVELVALVYATTPTELRGDPGRIRQVLMNLVGNAIKFTDTGEVVVQVSATHDQENNVVIRFAVTDTGIGLSEEAQGRLFQSFSQADSSTTRKYGGTGLGLAICKKIITLMGGDIGVMSSEGEGSEFWFTVPLQRQTTSQRPLPSRTNLNGVHACLVESNDTVRFLIHHYAQSWNMTCTVAANGSEALDLLRTAVTNEAPCDLIIVAQQLTDMSGADFARLVKDDPLLADSRLIMLSSLGQRGEARRAQKAGFMAYLTKPVRQEQLYRCLTMAMGTTPQATMEDQRSSTTLITRHTLEEAEKRSRIRILLAEDNIVNQKVATKMLDKLGYRIDVVANGQEATEAVNRITYDVILMDCQMPEMDGFQATRAIRAREASTEIRDTNNELCSTPRVPIIALTANAMKGDRERCVEAGMDDFISKPVNIEQLEETLRQWIPQKMFPHQDETVTRSDKIETDQVNSVGDHQAAPLDMQILEELRDLGGDDDSEFLISVIDQFLKDIPRHIEDIRQAIDHDDADSLMKAAHGFKGSCRNIGAKPLADLCCALEQLGREGTTKGASPILTRLETEESRVQSALQMELQTKT